MVRYLFDTNVISDYLSESFGGEELQLLENIIDQVPNMSIITKIELLCWRHDSRVEKIIRNFAKDSEVININDKIVELCVQIRKNKKIKTPDAIIAATAIATNSVLLTNNEKDFHGIKRLKVLNPHKLRKTKAKT